MVCGESGWGSRRRWTAHLGDRLFSRAADAGDRPALGALPGDVLGAVLKEGPTPVAVGIACGVPGAPMAAGAVRGLLFGVGPLDPAVLGSAARVLLLAGAAACYVPGRRASRLDPLRPPWNFTHLIRVLFTWA